MFRPRASARGISLDLEAAPGAPAVEVDREMMAQLLLNLLTNALQAIEKEGRIRVSVSPFPNRDGVVLTVADTGRGMSPEELGRIFEPFFTTKEEGTGLGLPVCQRIVRAHGGALEVKSEAGAGTTVVVLVPGRRARAGTGLADPPGSGAEGGIPA
jgi:signal transduction histidine kinase